MKQPFLSTTANGRGALLFLQSTRLSLNESSASVNDDPWASGVRHSTSQLWPGKFTQTTASLSPSGERLTSQLWPGKFAETAAALSPSGQA